jgi:mannosyltransferase
MNNTVWKKISCKNHVEWLILLSIILLSLALRLYHLDFLPLWYDEAVSYTRALMPIDEIIEKTIATDTWPPLYYIFLHYVIYPGSSEFTIRLSSTLFGILTIWVIYRIAKIINSSQTAWVSALLMAVSPLHITYSQEARGYALYCFAASVSLLGLAIAVKTVLISVDKKIDPNRLYLGLLVYTLGSVVVLYTNNIGIFYVFSANIFGLYWLWTLGFNKRILAAWLISNLAILFLWLPWIPGLLEQKQNSTDSLNWFGSDLNALIDMINDMWITYVWKYRPLFTLILLSVLVFTWRSLQSKLIWLVFLICFSLVPVLLAYTTSQFTAVLVSRAFIWVSIPFLIILALAICHIKQWWLKTGTLLFLILLSAKGNMTYFQDFSKERWDWVASHIASNYQLGDVVLITPGYMKKALSYYVDKENAPIIIESFPDDHDTINNYDIKKLEDNRNLYQRIWLIKVHSTDPNNLLVPSLKQVMGIKTLNYFPRTGFSSNCETAACIEVYLFESLSP